MEDYEEEDEAELEDAPPTNFTIHFNISGQNGAEMEEYDEEEEEDEEEDDEEEEEDEESNSIPNTDKNKDAIEKLRKMIADYATTCGEDEPEIVKNMKRELEETEKKMKRRKRKRKIKVKTKNAKIQ